MVLKTSNTKNKL